MTNQSCLRSSIIVALTLGLGGPAFCAGSGGLRNETPDARAFGMGSAFIGQADSPAAMYYNPAGINQMKTPTVTVGALLIAPAASFQTPDDQYAKTTKKIYSIPDFYFAAPVTDKLSIGAGGGTYWGLGTKFGPNSALRYASTQATVANTDLMVAASYQLTPRWSLAASLDNDYSRVDEALKVAVAGSPDGAFRLREQNDAWGYRLATMFKINEQHQVGLMYRSRLIHRYSGRVYMDGILPTSVVTRVKENITLPQSVAMGWHYEPTNRWKINLDVEWFDWRSVKTENLDFPNVTDPVTLATLNLFKTIPHNWRSTWSESIGAEYAVTERFRVRGGYYHHTSVGPAQTFNPAVGDMNSHGFTLGLGYDISSHLTMDLAYGIALYEPRTFYGNAITAINGTYREYLNFAAASFTYKF